MTSPSRKKRPTTRRSIPPSIDLAAGGWAGRRHPRHEPVWLPAGGLAVLLMLTLAINAAGGVPSPFSAAGDGWRPLGAGAAVAYPDDEPARPMAAASGTAASRLVMVHQDSRVRPTAYGPSTEREAGVGGWRRSGSSPAAATRSVVTRRTLQSPDGSFRLAQGDGADFGTELRARELDDRELQQQLEAPFNGGEPADAEPLPMPLDAERAVPPPRGAGEAAGGDGEGPLLGAPVLPRKPVDASGGVDTLPPLDGPPAAFSGGEDANDPPSELPLEDPSVERGLMDEPLGGDRLGGELLGDGGLGGRYDEQLERDEAAEAAERRRDSIKSCAEELAELKASRLSDVDIRIGVTGREGEDYPFNCSIDDGTPFVPRGWAPVTYMWKASGLCHKPLYFEQAALERYGHSWGPYLDPVLTGVHFFGRVPALPFMMGLQAPGECVYTLGHYRPGSCAPYLLDPLPMTGRAAAWEAAAWTGGVFLVP